MKPNSEKRHLKKKKKKKNTHQKTPQKLILQIRLIFKHDKQYANK